MEAVERGESCKMSEGRSISCFKDVRLGCHECSSKLVVRFVGWVEVCL